MLNYDPTKEKKMEKTREEELLKELLQIVKDKENNNAGQIWERLKKYRDKKQEFFLVIILDNKFGITEIKEISKGSLNKIIVHPREVFRTAIMNSASSIIISHNHPSGNFEPSEEDKRLTKRLVKAGEIIGIDVLDHIIISKFGYFSFNEKGLI